MSFALKIFLPLALFISLPVSTFANVAGQPIPTVDHVDLESYIGLWHEILRVENKFQDNEPSPGDGPCFNTTAEYSFLPKGKIRVKNTCYRRSGSEIAKAKAHAVRGSNNAKLKVNFTGIPFLEWLGIGNGDYWILALGEKNAEGFYSWVLVGAPKLDYGWILSRTPIMADSDKDQALEVAAKVGYDTKLFKAFQR